MPNEKGVATDTPEVLAILKAALADFLGAAHKNGFELPLDFAVTDQDGIVLREFTLERNGKLVLGKTDDPNGTFLLPLTIYVTDSARRTARMRINAERIVEPVEMPN